MRLFTLMLLSILAAGPACSKAQTAAPAAAAPSEKTQAAPAYEPMAFFARLDGTAWRGEGTAPDGGAVIDGAYYEMILDGRALQSTHRLQGGDYGGRTIFFYDEGAKKYVYHYFTTAGFHTMGEIVLSDGGFSAVESVIGHPTIVEVRSKAVFGDGVITVSSQHVDKDGAVSGGDGFVYHQVERDQILLFDEADALFGKRSEVKDSHDRQANE